MQEYFLSFLQFELSATDLALASLDKLPEGEEKSPLLFRKAHGRDFLDTQSHKTGKGNASPL